MPPCPPRTLQTSCRRSFAVTRYANTHSFQPTFECGKNHCLLSSNVQQCDGVHSVLTVCLQDCLRACQEQIESLLESSLRQAQQHSSTTEPKCVDGDVDLSCTPTDVRDVNIWKDGQPCCTVTWSLRESCEHGDGWAAMVANMPLTWPLSSMTAKMRAHACPATKPQVTFPASVPSHPAKRTEPYRNVSERKDTEY